MPFDKIVWINNLQGGRNDTDPPTMIQDNQVTEALNVDWKDATIAHKRGGSISVATTGGTAFSGFIRSAWRHVPGADETLAELWAVDSAAHWKRLTGGTSWADVTIDEAAANVRYVQAVSFNGKLFIAYSSSSDRLHCYDPTNGVAVRQVGATKPAAAPTVANTGAGAYAATLRYYRTREMIASGGVFYAVSEASASVSFTPSGAGTAARITKPTTQTTRATHWSVEVSLDNVTWYELNSIAIGTTTYDDNAATTSYSTGAVAKPAGFYTNWSSVKYLATDGNRLLGAGNWVSGNKQSRVWFSPVLGSADRGDDERVPNQTDQKNWVDLNENDGGGITGLSMPLNGIIYAFKYRQIWKLRPTGDVTTPYLPRKVTDQVGCIDFHTITLGEDAIGRPAIYFLSHKGPYRITYDGDIQFLGRDNMNLWRSVNQSASGVVAGACYHTDLHQVWFVVSTGSNSLPDTKMIFDVQRGFPDVNGQIRGGWAKHTLPASSVTTPVMFANTLGAAMSLDLKPYMFDASGNAQTLYKCDTSDLTDNGTNFQAYVKLKPLRSKPGMEMNLKFPNVLAKAASNTNLAMTLIRDFGVETYTAQSQSIAAGGSETRVTAGFDLDMSGATFIEVQVGDAAAAGVGWTIDELTLPITEQEPT